MQVVEEWHKQHGPIFRISQMGIKRETVFVQNPETMQIVFKNDGNRPIAYRFGHPHLEGDEWEEFRSKVI